MKIGVIGWYNHDNYGDDRILYCLKQFFSDYDFLVINSWNEARKKIDDLNKCDYILIGGGGFILRGCGEFYDVILKIKKPFGLVGIGVEAKHKSMEPFLSAIKEKAEFILVRDFASKKRLDNHYKVIVGPDLTFLYPFELVAETKDGIAGMNLRNWHYWKSEFFGDFYKVMNRMSKKAPFLEKIYPFGKWNPEKAFNIVSQNFSEVTPLPFFFEENPISDKIVMEKYFKEVPSRFDVSIYSKIRYFIGMRLHSLIFSMQCGIPFISLSYQPKNFSFCDDNDLGDMSCDIYNLGLLDEKIKFMKDNYSTIKEKVIFQREKNVKDINYIFKSIFSLINTR